MRIAELDMSLSKLREEEECADFLCWADQQRTQKGQPSPVNDGILKENENGIHRI